MKNKSKLQKIKNRNTQNRILPPGWIIMSTDEVTVADIKSVLGNDGNIEIWKEAGVLEIPLGEKASVDIEAFEADPKDEYSCEFIKKNNVKSLFYLSFPDEAYDEAEKVIGKIAAGINGFVCGDTEDFSPVYSYKRFT